MTGPGRRYDVYQERFLDAETRERSGWKVGDRGVDRFESSHAYHAARDLGVLSFQIFVPW